MSLARQKYRNAVVPCFADDERMGTDRYILIDKGFDFPITLTTIHLLFQTIGASSESEDPSCSRTS